MVRSGVALVLVVLVVVSSVSAQLNFSPGWGKRAAASVAAGGEGAAQLHAAATGMGLPATSTMARGGDNCATIPISTVMHIYRLIKKEASRLVQCQDEEYLA